MRKLKDYPCFVWKKYSWEIRDEIEKEGIKRKDIQAIIPAENGFSLFYWEKVKSQKQDKKQ